MGIVLRCNKVPIYRFRLVRQGEVLRDEHQLNDLSAPTELQMTIHDFTDPDEDQIKRFLKAAEDGGAVDKKTTF